jgi:hypothetical protein
MGQFGNYGHHTGQPIDCVRTYSITEPSAVAPDTKFYRGEIRRQDQGVNESRTGATRFGGTLISGIRRYRARFCNGRAYLKLTVLPRAPVCFCQTGSNT